MVFLVGGQYTVNLQNVGKVYISSAINLRITDNSIKTD